MAHKGGGEGKDARRIARGEEEEEEKEYGETEKYSWGLQCSEGEYTRAILQDGERKTHEARNAIFSVERF